MTADWPRLPNVYNSAAAEWGWNPDTLVALTGFVTLLAALAAAAFAFGAWRAAVRQANAADAQIVLADRQLDLAREQAGQFSQQLIDQAEKDAALRRRELEARADATAPQMLIRFERFKPLQHQMISDQRGISNRQETLEDGDDRLLFVRAELSLRNVSAHTAEVWLQHWGNEFVTLSSNSIVQGGEAVVLAPGETQVWDWERSISTRVYRADDVHDRQARAHFVFHVRDLARNVRDTYEIGWSWSHVRKDGSRLKLDPTSQRPPVQPAAVITQRVYERLDTVTDSEEPAL